MADLAPTAANVALTTGNPSQVKAGATITGGQTVYKAADGEWGLAQCDGSAIEAGSLGLGVALCGGADGQYINVHELKVGDVIDLGCVLTVGEIYVLSQTAGGICPEADIVASDDYVVVLGVATAADGLYCLGGVHSGAQIP